jgi:hypothetical protein
MNVSNSSSFENVLAAPNSKSGAGVGTYVPVAVMPPLFAPLPLPFVPGTCGVHAIMLSNNATTNNDAITLLMKITCVVLFSARFLPLISIILPSIPIILVLVSLSLINTISRVQVGLK